MKLHTTYTLALSLHYCSCLLTLTFFQAVLNIVNFMAIINPIALRKAKIVCNFGLSECNKVKALCLALIITEFCQEISHTQLS